MQIQRLTPSATVLDELGKRLTRLRKLHRLSQQELATAAGIGVATLRRIEDGRDARLGSWVRLLLALDQAAAVDQLLPEHTGSPMAEATGRRRRRPKAPPADDGAGFRWGDER
ncbi:MAG TPA: XRE family transcriptional regulator [bacterium]|nr:XRE family transcriptional regulator [bacterium]